eukprot:TRINITY_DN1864_c0_g1_i1.p1 TRINITY_DN1864_c0_g1~~TRINITY_DN1864_c0_g1_i1.p1  ORF type:complete len:150 (+),score=45.30 TRINITY_DN1864_c0_g1_i1:162-611(+)
MEGSNGHGVVPNGAAHGGGGKHVEASLEALVESLRQAVIVIEEFRQDTGQDLLFKKINDSMAHLRALEEHRHEEDLMLPVEILNFIDQGKNPDLFIKESLEGCLKANERTRGKIHALQTFRDDLSTRLQELYPDEHKAYQTHIANPPPP